MSTTLQRFEIIRFTDWTLTVFKKLISEILKSNPDFSRIGKDMRKTLSTGSSQITL